MGDTFHIKRGALTPPLRGHLEDAKGVRPSLAGASVRFHMRKAGATTPHFAAVGASIVEAANAEVAHAWSAPQTAVAGAYEAEFEVIDAAGNPSRFPTPGFQSVVISESV